MRIQKRVLPTLLVSAFAALSAPAFGQQFSNVYVFGDSLSDAGYFKPVLAAAGVPASLNLGRFTTVPGPVWSELVSSYYGATPNPSNVSGGNIFAQGGARVATNSSATPPGAAQRPVSTQITEYLARGSGAADPNALYAIWAGANDVIQTFQGIGAGVIPPDQASGIIQGAAVAEIQQIGRLQAAGARNVMVFGLPNIGATPAFLSLGAANAAAATQLSAGFNTALFAGLATAGIRVIPVDAFALLSEIRANPTAYGFTNITTPACGPFPPFSSSSDALYCPASVWATPTANLTYAFADGIHPTTGAHAIIAQFAESMIDGPTGYSMLAEAPLASRRLHIRAVADASLNAQLAKQGEWNVFITGASGDFTIDAKGPAGGLDGTNKGYTVGVGVHASEAFSIGAAIGHSEFDGSFGNNRGGYDSTENTLSVFASMRVGGFWGTGVLSISDIDFRNIRRNVALGAATRSTDASTNGSNSSASLSIGYDFAFGSLFIGPWGGVQSQNVDVSSFEEANGSSINLRIGSQKRRSEVWRLGARAYYFMGNWTPFVSVTADRERRDDARFVTATPLSLISTGNSYDVMAYRGDTDSVTWLAGIHGRLHEKIGLSLSYYNVGSRSGIKEDGIAGVLSYKF